jgi:cold shock CspA family protein
MRERGTVVCFGATYGFLMPLVGGGKGKTFVHWSDIIDMPGRRTLWPGDLVEYEVEQGELGRHAVRVKVIQSAETGEPREREEVVSYG